MPLLSEDLLLSPYLLLGFPPGQGHFGSGFHRTSSREDDLIGGPARLVFAPIETPFPNSIGEIINLTSNGTNKYNAINGWKDIGATKNGIKISSQHLDNSIRVDRKDGSIVEYPTGYELKIATELAQIDMNNLSSIWKTSPQDYNPITLEEKLSLGKSSVSGYMRVAVLFQKNDGNIRAYVIRRALVSYDESSVNFQKATQTSVSMNITGYCDRNASSVNNMYGTIYNQVDVYRIPEPEEDFHIYPFSKVLGINTKLTRATNVKQKNVLGVKAYLETTDPSSLLPFYVRGFVYNSFKEPAFSGGGTIIGMLKGITQEEILSNNLASNGDFTNSVSGDLYANTYSGATTCTVTRETTGGLFGINCAKAVTSGISNQGLVVQGRGMDSIEGKVFTASAYVNQISGTLPVELTVSYINSGGSVISQEYLDAGYATSGYKRFSGTSTTPTGTKRIDVTVNVGFGGGSGSSIFLVDGVLVTHGPKLREFYPLGMPAQTVNMMLTTPINMYSYTDENIDPTRGFASVVFGGANLKLQGRAENSVSTTSEAYSDSINSNVYGNSTYIKELDDEVVSQSNSVSVGLIQ